MVKLVLPCAMSSSVRPVTGVEPVAQVVCEDERSDQSGFARYCGVGESAADGVYSAEFPAYWSTTFLLAEEVRLEVVQREGR